MTFGSLFCGRRQRDRRSGKLTCINYLRSSRFVTSSLTSHSESSRVCSRCPEKFVRDASVLPSQHQVYPQFHKYRPKARIMRTSTTAASQSSSENFSTSMTCLESSRDTSPQFPSLYKLISSLPPVPHTFGRRSRTRCDPRQSVPCNSASLVRHSSLPVSIFRSLRNRSSQARTKLYVSRDADSYNRIY